MRPKNAIASSPLVTTAITLAVITILSYFLAKIAWLAELGLSSLPLAIILGITAGFFIRNPVAAIPDKAAQFCQQKLLRLGIILFGFNLTIQQLVALGWQVIVIDLLIISTVLVVGITLGMRWLKLPKELAVLTSIGSAVCGAAAIMAAEPVVKGGHKHVSVAVATVVIFGTLSLLAYPLLYPLLALSPEHFGIFIGSTVHEVAQAVAAGETISPEALQTALLTKLVRVLCLAPVVVCLALVLFRTSGKEQVKNGENLRDKIVLPWFILYFLLAIGVNSLIALPEATGELIQVISQLSLTAAMAAMGFNTRLSCLRQAGIKPLLLAGILFVVLMATGVTANLVLLPKV
ncbi:MAG: YeiH family putative sulfate export transporter [Oceanospirillum sp.]|nr:YeiH family putative sulfate export transporter [Oceanospirillum sp.]